MLGVFEVTILSIDAMWQQASCGMQGRVLPGAPAMIFRLRFGPEIEFVLEAIVAGYAAGVALGLLGLVSRCSAEANVAARASSRAFSFATGAQGGVINRKLPSGLCSASPRSLSL
jgi:hypothetical protein